MLFMEREKRQQNPGEGHGFKDNKKYRCIQAGIFITSLFSL